MTIDTWSVLKHGNLAEFPVFQVSPQHLPLVVDVVPMVHLKMNSHSVPLVQLHVSEILDVLNINEQVTFMGETMTSFDTDTLTCIAEINDN